MPPVIPYRLGMQQRIFPAYRAAFFDALASACVGGLSVFAGEPMEDEAIGQRGLLRMARFVPARNLYLGWGPFLFVWQRGLVGWLERFQPDVLVVEANPRNMTTTRAIHWMHARQRVVIGWGLGAPPAAGPFPALVSASRRRFLSHFDALIAYSRTGADQFLAAGVSSERIFIAPNAATPRPPPLSERPPGFRDGRPVVLFVGRLQARKRVDALLRACAALPEALRPRLQVVGDGPERKALQDLALRVFPAAEFPGDKRGAALEAYYTGADLFVLPGTGGLAVQQAMSHGLPVLVAEADGTQSELVRPGNGWLIPPGDDTALVRGLAEALADPARLRAMGRESHRIVDEEVNLERMVDVFARAILYVAS